VHRRLLAAEEINAVARDSHLDQAPQIIRNVRRFVSCHKPMFQSLPLGDLINRMLLLKQPIRAGGVHIE
jgi:hypothetical protein